MRLHSLLPISVVGLFSVWLFQGCGSSSTDDPTDLDAGDGVLDGARVDSAQGHPDAHATPDAPSIDDAEARGDATSPTQNTVITVVFENHDYAEVVGSANAPYLNSLISSYGLATNYKDCLTHPSLPNYLTMIAGDKLYPGVFDLPPKTLGTFPKNKPHIGAQMETAKIEWRAYQEGMGAACNLSDHGNYAARHTPFLYFTDIQSNAALCAKRVVDYSNFAADLAGGTYRYMFVAPDLINDGHNPTNDPVTGLKQIEAWATKEIPKILASDAYKNGAILFITWDEAEGRNGDSKDQIPMIVVSNRIASAGFKSNSAYSHVNYLATVEDLLGLPRLATVTGTATMMEFLK